MAGPNAAPASADAQPNASLDPDSDQWADLVKELEGDDPLLGEGEPPAEPPAPAGEPPADDAEPPEPKAKPSYDELQRYYSNTREALKQERQQAREAREQLGNITRFVEGLREQRNQQPRQPDAPPAPPKAPSRDEDPIGYFEHELARRDQVIQQLQQGTAQSVQEVQRQQQWSQFVSHIERSEQAMRAKAPDYDEAAEHLEQGRIAQLKVMLPDNSPQAQAFARQSGFQTVEQLRMQMLNNDRIQVARQAIQLGMSPAELYYNLAKQGGYVGKGGNGRQSPADLKIETARRGQKAARSLGNASGSAENPLSNDRLLELWEEDPEAFDAAWDKMARSGRLG